MKQLKDYLHLYLGCELAKKDLPDSFKEGARKANVLDGETRDYFLKSGNSGWLPILRPLSSMTEEELQECGNMIYDFSDDPELNNHKWQDFEISAPEQFHYLLSKHFDLFNLIPEGLAIDATTLKPA